MGKECGSNVSSHLWGGALCDETQKYGYVGDYDLCWSVENFTGVVFLFLWVLLIC